MTETTETTYVALTAKGNPIKGWTTTVREEAEWWLETGQVAGIGKIVPLVVNPRG